MARREWEFRFSRALGFILAATCFWLLVTGAVEAQTKPRPAAQQLEARLRAAAERHPDSFAAQRQLGEFYLQQKKIEAAIPWLVRARQLDPAHYANGYDLALAYLQTRRLPQARAELERLLNQHDKAELHSLMGDVEAQAGDLFASAEAYQRAAQRDESEQHLLDRANSLIKLSAFNEAAQIYEYSLGKFPRSSKLLTGLGIAQYARGQYAEAVRTLCRAVDIDPTDARPYVFLGELYGTSAATSDELSRRMRQFVEHHPRHALAHFYLAMSWRKSGEPAEGMLPRIEATLKQAVALDPRLARAHYELGALYAEQRRDAAAIQSLRQAARLEPNDEKSYYRLAQLYQRAGQTALAAQASEKFKQLKEQNAAKK